MEIKHLDYIYCHDGCTQPLSIAKVRNKYVFIYSLMENSSHQQDCLLRTVLPLHQIILPS